MGYYTRFKLTVNQKLEKPEDITLDIFGEDESLMEVPDKHVEKRGYRYFTDFGGERFKWYNHDEDMKELSEKHPDVVFRLDGEGEDPGDIWVHFFKNGKIQRWSLDLKEIISKVKFNPEELI